MDKAIKWETIDQQFPAGTTPGGWRILVTNGNVTHQQDVAEDIRAAVFSLEPGEWTASVFRVDASGGPLQDPVQRSFTVDAPALVTIAIASAVNVTDPDVTVSIANRVSA